MSIIERITRLILRDSSAEVAVTFRRELDRQCQPMILAVSFVALLSWFPYIQLDWELHGQIYQLVFLRLGFTLAGMIALIFQLFPYFKTKGYHILLMLLCYLELSSAVILGLVAADPVYMGGFSILIMILPMAPFQRKHTLMLLSATLTLFLVAGLASGMTFEEWDDRYGLYNFIVAMGVSFLATLLLHGIRLRNYNKSLLVQKKNDELTEAAMEITQINEELENSAIELSRTNEELQRANEIKSDLLGIAAHDLKNPLQVIIGYTDLLQDKVESDPVAQKQLKMINKSSDKMLKLITGLLETASITRGKLIIKKRPVDLAEMTKSVVNHNRPLATNKNQTIDTSVKSGCIVHGDSLLLQEVMENLVSNAIKFSPRGTTIWLELYRENNLVLFKVRDEGPGFTAEDKRKIFSKYQKLSAKPTAGESSTGLGLSIVRNLVELHNGDVFVSSEEGKGSTFTVQLPASEVS